MAEPLAALLEARERTAVGPRHVVARGRLIVQCCAAPAPSRACAPHTAASRSPCERRRRARACARPGPRSRLHDAALVVPLLVPRIREVEQHFVERRVRDPALEHLDRVVADRRGRSSGPRPRSAASSGRRRAMHFDAEEVALRDALQQARPATRRCRSRSRACAAHRDRRRAARSSGASPSSMPSVGHSSRQARSCATVMRPARTTKLRIARCGRPLGVSVGDSAPDSSGPAGFSGFGIQGLQFAAGEEATQS